jgi:hypothetical protein
MLKVLLFPIIILTILFAPVVIIAVNIGALLSFIAAWFKNRTWFFKTKRFGQA